MGCRKTRGAEFLETIQYSFLLRNSHVQSQEKAQYQNSRKAGQIIQLAISTISSFLPHVWTTRKPNMLESPKCIQIANQQSKHILADASLVSSRNTVQISIKKGQLLNNVAMVQNPYHCVYGTSCFCTLSASAFIEPSLNFSFEIIMETCFCSFFIVIYTLYQHCIVVPAHALTAITNPSLHGQIFAQLNGIQHDSILLISQKSLEDAQRRLQFCFKLSTKVPSLGHILMIDYELLSMAVLTVSLHVLQRKAG